MCACATRACAAHFLLPEDAGVQPTQFGMACQNTQLPACQTTRLPHEQTRVYSMVCAWPLQDYGIPTACLSHAWLMPNACLPHVCFISNAWLPHAYRRNTACLNTCPKFAHRKSPACLNACQPPGFRMSTACSPHVHTRIDCMPTSVCEHMRHMWLPCVNTCLNPYVFTRNACGCK